MQDSRRRRGWMIQRRHRSLRRTTPLHQGGSRVAYSSCIRCAIGRWRSERARPLCSRPAPAVPPIRAAARLLPLFPVQHACSGMLIAVRAESLTVGGWGLLVAESVKQEVRWNGEGDTKAKA